MAPLLLNGLDGLNALNAATRDMLAATGTTMAHPLPTYWRSSLGRFDYITARGGVNWGIGSRWTLLKETHTLN
jgi:hypothetical protein